MAKTSAIEKNKRRARLIEKYAARRAELKALAKDNSLPAEERFAARLKLAKLPRNSSPVRLRLRCDLTGRPRGVYRKFRLSRIALRDLALSGKIPGMVKSSW
ncbi:MAG: 30S ribosomal protein S14 [Alphaproteobacteria bacterium]|nr:30S ribosomal protein S14 [Alphaproteobacteria bacterium]